LKALALGRLGKEEECKALMDTLFKEESCDDSTLQVMSLCYREMDQCMLYLYRLNPKKQIKYEMLAKLIMSRMSNRY